MKTVAFAIGVVSSFNVAMRTRIHKDLERNQPQKIQGLDKANRVQLYCLLCAYSSVQETHQKIGMFEFIKRIEAMHETRTK